MRLKSALFLIVFRSPLFAQCDLELLDVDFYAGSYTIAFHNTNNCGGTGGPDGISEIQIGFQAVDPNNDCAAMNQGWTFPSGISIPDDNNHPGWIYTSTTSELSGSWTNLYTDDVDPPYYTGDTITFPMYNVYQNDCVDGFWATYLSCQMQDALQFWIDEGLSIQAVIWQISYGPTVYADDGGWAEIGPNGDGTNWGSGIYEDENFLDNWLVLGPCGENIPEVITDTIYITLPPDTVEYYITDTLFQTDTLYIDIWYYTTDTVYQVDTLIEYVQLPADTIYTPVYITVTDTLYQQEYVYVTDTLYQQEYVTDTLYQQEYVYVTDTMYTYEFSYVDVDCETGSPCIDPVYNCPIYIPNSFTPDNDGYNDVWGAETPSECWGDWNMRVYSRSGDMVWDSYYPDDVWIGGDEYYIPDGVYVYRLECSMAGASYIINGHVTIIR